MRNEVTRATLVSVVQQARFEVLPTPSTEDKVLASLPTDRVVTITASPGKGLEPTFALAESLGGQGYDVVPHLAARMISGRSELAEICDRLVGHGVTTVFVPGGDAEPAGAYHDALSLLEDLDALGRPFAQVGITGYPESHPTIHDDLTVQSMWDKRRYATHIVSNLTFDPSSISSWLGRLRRRGVTLPVLLGIPGPVERTKLLGDGDQDRGGGVDPLPGQAQGDVRPAGRAGRLHRRAVPREVRAGARRSRRQRRPACTSSPSTRSPRPRPGAARCWSGSSGEQNGSSA